VKATLREHLGDLGSMAEIDPGFRRTRRESLFLIVPWLVCCLWSVTYCYLFGYRDHARKPGDVSSLLPDLSGYDPFGAPLLDPLGWGMPTWIFWGVFVPWMVSIVFSIVYALFVMNDAGDDDAPAGEES
jgi:hypothetical protein